jgi:hypothetical protein
MCAAILRWRHPDMLSKQAREVALIRKPGRKGYLTKATLGHE